MNATSFIENSSNSNGGALYVYKGTEILASNCSFEKNAARSWGGVAFTRDTPVTTFRASNLVKSSALYGGALFNTEGAYRLEDSVISENTANSGGAIYGLTNGDLTLNRCTLRSNNAYGDHGGAIAVSSSTLKITDSVLSDNQAHKGASLYLSDSTGEMVECSDTNSAASSSGGSAYIAYGVCIYFEYFLPN